MRVYSHSYWLVVFCTTNSSRVLAKGEKANFREFLEKNTIFNKHTVHVYVYTRSLQKNLYKRKLTFDLSVLELELDLARLEVLPFEPFFLGLYRCAMIMQLPLPIS